MSRPRLLDTIVAQATPRGLGAVALVRLSGPRSWEIAAGMMAEAGNAQGNGNPLREWPVRSGRLRTLYRPGTREAIDQALVSVFRAPASYTGEDVVEIYTHGSLSIPTEVVEGCRVLGARVAEAGEFTQRAYLNGKMDLTQAEAVDDIVRAASPRARAVALRQLDRGLSRRIARLRSELIGLAARLVHHIDFPEEDDAPVPVANIAAEADGVMGRIDRLLATAPAGELLREGATVVLAGPPNAGKSSLFNALVGSERAIVTAEPGTTRDAIEAVVAMDGFPFRLVDTAGLREGESGIERMGIEIAHRYLDEADAIIFCREVGDANGAKGWREAEWKGWREWRCPVVSVRTKWDLAGRKMVPDGDEIPVSAHSGEGLAALKDRLGSMIFGGLTRGGREVGGVVTNRRQADHLRVARRELESFAGALRKGIPGEFASTHLKSAESALEEIVGVVGEEEILDRVFGDFCIGK